MDDSAMVQIIKSAVLDVHNLNNIFVGSEKIIFTFCFHMDHMVHIRGADGLRVMVDGLQIDGLTDYGLTV